MDLAIICQPAIFNLICRWGFTCRGWSVIIALDLYSAGSDKGESANYDWCRVSGE